MKCSLDNSNFFKEISSLSHYLCCSYKKVILSLFAILWNSAFRWVYLSLSPLPFASLLFSAICKVYSGNHFAFLHFFFLGIVLVTTYCTMLQTSVHSSSGTLSTRSSPLNLFVTPTVCMPWTRVKNLWWESDTILSSCLIWPRPMWGEDNGTPLQCSCLENPMDRGAW